MPKIKNWSVLVDMYNEKTWSLDETRNTITYNISVKRIGFVKDKAWWELFLQEVKDGRIKGEHSLTKRNIMFTSKREAVDLAVKIMRQNPTIKDISKMWNGTDGITTTV